MNKDTNPSQSVPPPSPEAAARLVQQWNEAHGNQPNVPVIWKHYDGREVREMTASPAYLYGDQAGAAIRLVGQRRAVSLTSVRHDPGHKIDLVTNPGGES